MTVTILLKDQIRAQILKILSGYCFRQRKPSDPYICILSPWISDVQLEIDAEVFELDELWFGLDYGIRSINLPYALLLLKLDFGAKIEIVTLPATKRNYGDRSSWVKNLLDFLDEIGCNVFINSDLHSKLMLSNDLALVGSFNLSKSALYDREEIGVSIDDMSNLNALEQYADDVIRSSTPYGYNVNAMDSYVYSSPIRKVTRGCLYEQIVGLWYGTYFPGRGRESAGGLFDEFLIDNIIDAKVYYLNDVVKELALDLDAFYVKVITTYLEAPHQSKEEKLQFLKSRFDYKGTYEIGKILDFLRTILAREHIPKLRLRMLSMKKPKPI